LLAKIYYGLTAWDIARVGNTEILEELWGWGREVQVYLKDDLLLAEGYYGLPAWDIAARDGTTEIL
jgi:hypothetical protein